MSRVKILETGEHSELEINQIVLTQIVAVVPTGWLIILWRRLYFTAHRGNRLGILRLGRSVLKGLPLGMERA
jgi:hypothetical protein